MQSHCWKVLGFLLSVGVASPGGAEVITSSSILTNASITLEGDDPKGPASAGTLLSQVIDDDGFLGDFSDAASARGAFSTSGTGAVSVEGVYASPSLGPITLLAETTWTQTAEITGSSAESLSMQLKIAPATLTLIDFAFVGVGSNESTASYDLALKLNGSTVFDSTAVLSGGRSNHSLFESGTDLGGVFFDNGSTLGYNFSPLTTSIELGTFDPGDMLTIEYMMRASVTTPQFETGGAANIGDPLNLGGDAVELLLTSKPPSAVPEPSTALSLLLVLGLMPANRRRCRATRARAATRALVSR